MYFGDFSVEKPVPSCLPDSGSLENAADHGW
jgi:hypothetical protein